MAFNTNYHDSGLFGVYAVTDRWAAAGRGAWGRGGVVVVARAAARARAALAHSLGRKRRAKR